MTDLDEDSIRRARIALGQKCLDLAHSHAARVHRNNAFIEAGKLALVLGDQNRLKGPSRSLGKIAPHRAAVG